MIPIISLTLQRIMLVREGESYSDDFKSENMKQIHYIISSKNTNYIDKLRGFDWIMQRIALHAKATKV